MSFCRTLVSEECGKKDIGGGKGTIFLDPVDGTHNALAGIPFYALSIAYAEDGVVQQAFVRDLAHHETFTAERGGGAPGWRAHPGLPHSAPRRERHVCLWPEVQPRPGPLPGAEDPALASPRGIGPRALLCGIGKA